MVALQDDRGNPLTEADDVALSAYMHGLRQLNLFIGDPVASADEIEREHGLKVTEPDGRSYDLVVGAVAHRDYRELTAHRLAALVAPGGTLADLKGMWRGLQLGAAVNRWTL